MATTFAEWLGRRPRGTLSAIARKTGLSHQTIYRARDGHRVHRDTARLISEVTGGEVAEGDFPLVRAGRERDEADESEETPRSAA